MRATDQNKPKTRHKPVGPEMRLVMATATLMYTMHSANSGNPKREGRAHNQGRPRRHTPHHGGGCQWPNPLTHAYTTHEA